MKTFNELGLNEKLIKGLSKKNITEIPYLFQMGHV